MRRDEIGNSLSARAAPMPDVAPATVRGQPVRFLNQCKPTCDEYGVVKEVLWGGGHCGGRSFRREGPGSKIPRHLYDIALKLMTSTEGQNGSNNIQKDIQKQWKTERCG